MDGVEEEGGGGGGGGQPPIMMLTEHRLFSAKELRVTFEPGPFPLTEEKYINPDTVANKARADNAG